MESVLLHEAVSRLTQAASLAGLLNAAAFICVLAVVAAVVNNFISARKVNVVKEQRSIVATASMSFFFIGFYLLIRLGLGQFHLVSVWGSLGLRLAGLCLMTLGAIVNIRGRIELGQLWANQVRIYSDHELRSTGVFGIVRHPLYASLIWMGTGASLLYHNWASLIFLIVLFVPAMWYRARLEERLLSERLPQYEDYRQRVAMFIPGIY